MNIFAESYYQELSRLFVFLIPSHSRKIILKDPGDKLVGIYDYIVLQNIPGSTPDLQFYLKKIKKHTHSKTRIIVVYFNFIWKPILDLATKLRLRKKVNQEPNWFSPGDINGLFFLEGFEEIRSGKKLLLPLPSGVITKFINSFIGQLPVINKLCLITYQVYRPGVIKQKTAYSVSIIIPTRNEEGNIKGIFQKIPQLGSKTEIIFVEGHSKDKTYQAIKDEIKTNKQFNAKVFKQIGKGKADAVHLGFKMAKHDILMILDGDLTVSPNDLSKFYNCLLENRADFANGSRLVYPMEKQAMRTLNYLGNKFFSLMFSFLLSQKVKDTLCGTKVLFREDYLNIKKTQSFFGDFDPFGDFELLFGASKLNLKIIDIPIRYRERVYGTTNISRFRHGLLLFKMVVIGAKKLKFV